MKKMQLGILLGIGIILGAYSVIAGRTVRGIGIYTLGKKLGWFLSVSRHFTAIAAVILLAIFVVILILKLMKKRDTRGQKPAAEDKQNEIAPAIQDGKKIRPAAPQPEIAAESGQEAPVSSEPAEVQETKQKEPQMVSDQDTLLMPEDEPQTVSAKVCPNCGAEVKSDEAKFCIKCGAQITNSN